MAIQQENRRFTLKGTIGALTESVASFWKPMLVAAPLIGTALFFASGTNAQTSGNAVPSPTTAANGPVAPIETAAAARRKGPKIKEKEATNYRVANPSTPGAPAADVPIAPIDAPESARTGRPKEKVKEAGGRVASPPATTEPVAPPTERRRRGPKIRDDTPRDTSRIETPAPETQPTGRRKGPKGDVGSDHQGRTSATPLIIGALGAATALALVVSSGNDKPASP
jgi:hypothetical protein